MEKSLYIDDSLWEEMALRLKNKQTKTNYYKEMLDITDALQKDFFSIDASDAKEYYKILTNMQKQEKLKKKTIDKKVAILHSLFSWYKKQQGDDNDYKNPFDQFYHSDKYAYINPLTVPTKAELDEIVATVSINNVLACVMLLYEYAGIKMNEIEELKKKDVTIERNLVLVHIGTGNRERVVSIPKERCDSLLQAASSLSKPHVALLYNKYHKPIKRKIIQSYYREYLPNSEYDMNSVRTALIAYALATKDKEMVIKDMALNERWMERYMILTNRYGNIR